MRVLCTDCEGQGWLRCCGVVLFAVEMIIEIVYSALLLNCGRDRFNFNFFELCVGES